MTGQPETSDLPHDTAAVIAGNVTLVQERLLPEAGIAPDGWSEAVEYLSEFIERQRVRVEADAANRLESVIGSYLGEAAVQLYSGRWVQTEKGVAVEVCGILAFPFSKTAKQFANGIEDNIASFLRVIPALAENRRKEGGDDRT